MKTNFDAYLRYEELARTLRELAEEYPGFCKLLSIGKSYEGREIWLAELTNQETGQASTKPAFWVDGNTHAGEVTGSMAALLPIEYLLENHGKDDLATRLLDEQAFYVLPRLSPDGAERYLSTSHTLRATPRPWPEPEEEPGLHPEDVDGDGNILQMRVEDESGEWLVSRKDARLMVPRAPDEADPKTTYYRLYREGAFKDYDGFERKIAPPLYGLDMNRQYPYQWRAEDEQTGAGPYPLSEPESRAQVDFLLDHTNVFGAHTYHTFCGAILRPYSDRPDAEMPEHDLAVFKALGKNTRDHRLPEHLRLPRLPLRPEEVDNRRLRRLGLRLLWRLRLHHRVLVHGKGRRRGGRRLYRVLPQPTRGGLAEDARLERRGAGRRGLRAMETLRPSPARARRDRRLEDQIHGPEPAAEVPEGRVRETDPLRPRPRLHGPPPADQPRNRGALAGSPSHRADRRERGVPADQRE